MWILCCRAALQMSPLARNTLQTRPSENRCACEVNMYPLKPFFRHSIHLPNLWEVPMIRLLLSLAIAVVLATSYRASPRAASPGPGVGNIPQGTQTEDSFGNSFAVNHVTHVIATTQPVSCYTPEVPFTVSDGPVDWYTGETPCNGAATTGEDLGPYATQQGSNGGFPATAPVLVNNHSESDIQVDPTNPRHLLGSTKWFASAEGYNHLLGFYESWDGGKTWPVQGHIPGYEGFSDDTDPIGAFDGYGNYYSLILPYQLAYANATGSKLYQKSKLPNPAMPSEAVSVSVRPADANTDPKDWIVTRTNAAGVTGPDFVLMDDNQGQEPDKQWIVIDTNPYSPHYNTIYAMFVTFSFAGKVSKAYVSTATALPGGHHTDWTPLQRLPSENASASDTYLLPHVDPNGVVWTSITNFPSRQSRTTYSLGVDYSTDGGITWQGPLPVPGAQNVTIPPEAYPNTTFTDGITDTFTVGTATVNGRHPIYTSWEDYASGVDTIMLWGPFDGGQSWTPPARANDNLTRADEFQPNLAAAANGTVSVNFYDRRLLCPAAGSAEAAGAGLALDTINPRVGGTQPPPYGASNYCVNTSVQFYRANLLPLGNNIRLSAHTWDPQLNAPWRFGSSLFTGKDTFIGDYFGNDFAGTTNLSTSVSAFDDGTNPQHYQQHVIASVGIP